MPDQIHILDTPKNIFLVIHLFDAMSVNIFFYKLGQIDLQMFNLERKVPYNLEHREYMLLAWQHSGCAHCAGAKL